MTGGEPQKSEGRANREISDLVGAELTPAQRGRNGRVDADDLEGGPPVARRVQADRDRGPRVGETRGVDEGDPGREQDPRPEYAPSL